MTLKAANSQLAHNECLYKVVNVADDTTTVHDGTALLFGIYVNTVLSAHVLAIQDGSITVVSLAASSAAGTSILYPGIKFNTSIVATPNVSGTGSVTIAYLPIQ
jgi:hypothetical protein